MCQEFMYLGCVLDESCIDGVEYFRNLVRVRKVMGAIRSFMNPRTWQLECAKVLCEALCSSVILNITEELYGRRREDGIRAVQMNDLRHLFGIRSAKCMGERAIESYKGGG